MKLKALIGQKLNMSLSVDSHGQCFGVTLIKVAPATVARVAEKHALIGFGSKKNLSKPVQGQVKHLKDFSPRVLKEITLGTGKLEEGESLGVRDVFRKGDLVDVSGTSKGKGFAGGVKRHGFSGGPKTHGQSDRHRAPGSIGSGTTPGRVIKGLKMAGHMGHKKATIQGLEILEIDEENQLIKLKGAVPGPKRGLLLLTHSQKKKKAYHEPEIPAQPIAPKEEKTPNQESASHSSEENTNPEPGEEVSNG